MDRRTLELCRFAQHSKGTCGQSRGGGVVTSDSIRRSRSLGRVAVTHVQGPPKGGGALGMLGVTNTRLRSVPPQLGVSMAHILGRERGLRRSEMPVRAFQAGGAL